MTSVKQTFFDSVDYTFDDDGNPKAIDKQDVAFNSLSDSFEDEEDLTNIFDILGEGYDVTLSLARGKVTWKAMSPRSNSGRRKSKGLSSLFKNNKSSASHTEGVDLRDIYGAKVKRRRRADQKEGEGFCLGFGLFTFEKKESANILKDKVIFFEHPSEEICLRWTRKISAYIRAFPGRPRAVKLFLQKHAGSKGGQLLYRNTILPMFRNADVSVDMTEVQYNEHIKQEMIHINIEDYDCIVAMGGDGTANHVADGLLTRWQKEQGVDMKSGTDPFKCRVPLGIIPIGLTNHIAGSVMGSVDPVTATLHILYGHIQNVDVCSIYSEEKFVKWGFNSQYGFAGNIMTFRSRYSALGAKKIDAAFMKALTKAKLRSYACDIEYIPAPGISTPLLNTQCRSGCRVCWGEDQDGKESFTQDMVQELDPLAESGSSGSLIEMAQDNPWKTVKGSFMNVALLTVSGRGEFAPSGLGKCTHLCDGNMDLVLVKETDRKEFIRFLKRHGNVKNQFDFPFVEIHRVKEVRFRPRMPTSWSYKDHNFSEIDYEMSKLKNKRNSYSPGVINDIDIDEDFDSSRSPSQKSDFRNRADSVKALNGLSESDNDEGDDVEDDSDDDNYNRSEGPPARRQSAPASPLSQKPRLVGPQYRMTFREQEQARRDRKQQKKEEKAKQKQEARMHSVWTVDNELFQHREIEFRVHHSLLQICGQGVSPETEPEEVTFGCLQFLK